MITLPFLAASPSPYVTVRVEKATSEFLIEPDWTLNMEICDTMNSTQVLGKGFVKAVKRRLQHKYPKVQLLALTLLEMMVKNCGDYVHLQIAERNILQEMVKIVKKEPDMQVKNKILTLIRSWFEAFGGHGGRYPQCYMAYDDLMFSGIECPQPSPDSVLIFTPPVQQISEHSQPGYGTTGSSATRLGKAMATEESISSSSMNFMRNALDFLADMLQVIDPSDCLAIKDEVIVELVEQCRANQRKLMQMMATTIDEQLLGQGLELNDGLQNMLARHDAIAASGSLLPPEVPNAIYGASEKHDSILQSAKVSFPNPASNDPRSEPVFPAPMSTIEQNEEQDGFAQLARRHAKTGNEISGKASPGKSGAEPLGSPTSHSKNNALVLVDTPASAQTNDQDIIELLSITLSTPTSTEQTGQAPTSPMHTQEQNTSSNCPGNNYIASWARSQPQIQYASAYPPPPWPATPRSTNSTVLQQEFASKKAQLNASHGQSARQRPFIPSHRLFEDLDVFGNTDGRFNGSPSLLGPHGQNVTGGE